MQFSKQKEYELMQKLEDEFKCSGMCRKGLFYFSRSITEGRPKLTCMHKMIQELTNDASSVASTCKWCAASSFILFILTFSMYHRSYVAGGLLDKIVKPSAQQDAVELSENAKGPRSGD